MHNDPANANLNERQEVPRAARFNPDPCELLQLVREGVRIDPYDTLMEPVWNQQVADYVAEQFRPGQRVKLKELDSGEREVFPKIEVEHNLETLYQTLRGNGSNFAKTQAATQIAVLETCRDLATALDGRKPTVVQVVAALTLRAGMGGLDGEEFKDAVSHMDARYRNQRGTFEIPRPWEGQPRPFNEALAWRIDGNPPINLALMAVERLVQGAGEMLTTKELASELEISGLGDESEHRLNTGLQIVSLIGLVRKHPYHRDPEVNQPVMVWSWSGADPCKRDLINPNMIILEAAYTGPIQLQSLYRPLGHNGGNPEAHFSPTTILGTAANLASLGLITVDTVSGETHPFSQATITELGRHLIREWVAKSIGEPLQTENSERLRSILLHVKQAV